MYEARKAGLSYPQIGRALGRDHSTVIDGVRAEEKRRAL
jgi:chromosomal replication initiation ATPase DnaA